MEEDGKVSLGVKEELNEKFIQPLVISSYPDKKLNPNNYPEDSKISALGKRY